MHVVVTHTLLARGQTVVAMLCAQGSQVAWRRERTKPVGGRAITKLMNLRVLTRAVQLLSDVDFWNMQDYCPEDSEFLDGEIVIVEARDTNSRYKRVTLVYPDESDDPRVSRLAEWARKWARA